MSDTALLPLAVYIHWPYCARICPYCDFNVLRDRGQEEQAILAGAIVRDLEAQAELTGPRRLTSVFFGGGTPSLMRPEWVARILATARRLWPTDGPLEVTLEANPTDAEASRFADLAAAGVERLSLGLQSLDDKALQFLGRNHDAAEGRHAAQTAMEVFARVSLDAIYALPDQSAQAWRAQLSEIVSLGSGHISPYQLTIEEGTAFHEAVKRGIFVPPEEGLAADLYETTHEVLSAAGFTAYEVSNHARTTEDRSVHNLAYWRGWDYVGAGPGAHGRLPGPRGRLATEGKRAVGAYIAQVNTAGVGFSDPEVLGPRQIAMERMFLGLRTAEGVPMIELAFLDLDRAKLQERSAQGYIVLAGGRLIATPRGRAVLDRLISDLIA